MHTNKPAAFEPRRANLATRLDFVTLKLFVAVIEEQSLAKAAEREAIAPSAVSKRIADIEAATSVQLLVRERKGMHPTEAGKAMLHYARSILREVARLESELLEHAAGGRGVVRILASESAFMRFVPGALASFNQRHPMIRVDLGTAVSPVVARAVLDGEADIGICWGATATDGLHMMPCYVDRLVAVVPYTHPLAGRESVRLSELLEYDIIEQEANSATQALLERSAFELGHPIRSRIRVGSYPAACNMADAGFGVAIVPDSFAAQLDRRGRVVKINENWSSRQFNLCTREPNTLSLQTRLVLEHLKACIARSK